MPRQDLLRLVLQQFSGDQVLTVDAVVRSVADVSPVLSEAEVRSAILSLLRRNELELTEQFGLRQTVDILAA